MGTADAGHEVAATTPSPLPLHSWTTFLDGGVRGVNAPLLVAVARAVIGAMMLFPSLSEAALVQKLPPLMPPQDLRMCLRWLCAAGVIDRSFSQAHALPPKPTLFSMQPGRHAAGVVVPSCAVMAALSAQVVGVGAPPLPLAAFVELWESSHMLLHNNTHSGGGGCSGGSVGSGGTGGGSKGEYEALTNALFECPASPCPLPGLITSYSATPFSLSRLAALSLALGVLAPPQ